MINKVAIRYLYSHTRRPANGFSRDLFTQVENCCHEFFKISFNENYMTVGSLDEGNPFKRIRLSNINGFKIFDKEVAVIMERSIIFFNNRTGSMKINFRASGQSWWQRLKGWFSFRSCHSNTCIG